MKHSINGQHCLLVGGGDKALQQALLLQQYGAVINVVTTSELLNEELQWLAIDTGGSSLVKDIESDDFQHCDFVVAADDDESFNQMVIELANDWQIPVWTGLEGGQ